jgi:eukaryotic-like serine/threonine-protein kinase
MSNRHDLNILATLVVLSLLFLEIPAQLVLAQADAHKKNGMINNNNNNNFATYQNPAHGIKIRYPADWQKTEHLGANRFSISFVSPFNNNNVSAFPATVSVSIEGLNQNMSTATASQYGSGIADSAKHSLADFQIIESNANASIAGAPAYKMIYTFLSQDPAVQAHFQSMNLWTVKDKKAYSISYTELKPLFAAYLPSVQKMVDSFEIIGK